MRTLTSVILACCLFITGCQQSSKCNNSCDGQQRQCRPPQLEQDDYYMVIGSFQGVRIRNKVNSCHTFAVFCRCHEDNLLDAKTISWLPSSLDLRFLSQEVQPGTNLNYHQTLNLSAANKCPVQLQQPKKITRELYCRACEQVRKLESGAVKYKCNDSDTRPNACNCINAIADMDKDIGILPTTNQRGHAAANTVQQHLRRWVMTENSKTNWLVKKLNEQKDK